METTASPSPKFPVLGVDVDAVQIPEVIARIEQWIAEKRASHFVAVTGMHGIMEAQEDDSFREVLNGADLVVPDGMPLVWMGRRNGFPLKRRVYGPELMETFCRVTGPAYRHFFYGGPPGLAEHLSGMLEEAYGIRGVGTFTPPFRPLTSPEEAEIADLINDAQPDVVWVGLSTPKQERWMSQFRPRLHPPVLLGVGAAFDFLSGGKRMAPEWMQENGLEWLFRLGTEPSRLWRRYLVSGSKFVWLLASQHLRNRPN